ncbi:hypothetical protein DL93DRAFT_412800 [Clavulina sp. PMI_390]|nr:hypothetical protein DL93DRAFT_412800 [Clavulina sp. PMI_390]
MTTIAAFAAARESIDSLDDFLNTIDTDNTPIILYHPPSTRSSHQSITQNRLEMLETFCHEVEGLFDKLSFMRKRLLFQRTACTGALSPVASMPVELLREIFQLVAETSRPTLPALLGVCRSWRSIASEYHELWTSVDLQQGLPSDGLVAHRLHSNSLPLDVHVDPSWSSWSRSLQKAFPDMDTRLSSLTWSTHASIADFLFLQWGTQFTALHTIKLCPPYGCDMCGGIDNIMRPGDFLRIAGFPSLRRLEVKNVRDLVIPQEVAEVLDHLDLQDTTLSGRTLCKTLWRASSLQSLVIQDIVDARAEPEAELESLVVLPSLETINLYGNPPELVNSVLRSCECPMLRSFQIGRCAPDITSPLYLELSSHLDTFLDRAPQLRELIVTRSTINELSLVISSQQTHGRHVKRLVFSTSPPLYEDIPPLLHLVEAMQLSRGAGLPPLELETFPRLIPPLRKTFPDSSLIPSIRWDCTFERRRGLESPLSS